MAARDAAVVQRVKLKSAIDLLGDDGIKAKLINKYIPTINKYVNMYLERMNMYVEFNLDNEFNESVNAVNRESFTYYSFSEGQKIRIDLAILLTWRKISQIRSSMSTNIFILDEVTDGSMDADGVTEFLSILRDVADVQNTFIISHSEGTIDLFDNVIRTETVGNYTRYTSE
jgi:DNA repair exonuclease SbcCD ATPase subunit